MLTLYPSGNSQQTPSSDPRLERDLTLSVIGAALDGKLERPVVLFSRENPLSQQLFGYATHAQPGSAAQRGSIAWWQAARSEYKAEALKLLSLKFPDEINVTSAGPKAAPNTIIRNYPACLCLLEKCMHKFDKFAVEPTQVDLELRSRLDNLYKKVANKFFAEMQALLQQRKFFEVQSALDHTLQLQARLSEVHQMQITAFAALNPHFKVLQRKVNSFMASRDTDPQKLATAIVKSALGNESLFHSHQRIIATMKQYFTNCWRMFFEDLPSDLDQENSPLVAQLLETPLCKEMIGLIQNDLETIDYTKWLGRGGIFYGNTKQLQHSKHMESVLIRMIVNELTNAAPFYRSTNVESWIRILQDWCEADEQSLDADIAALNARSLASRARTTSRPDFF